MFSVCVFAIEAELLFNLLVKLQVFNAFFLTFKILIQFVFWTPLSI